MKNFNLTKFKKFANILLPKKFAKKSFEVSCFESLKTFPVSQTLVGKARRFKGLFLFNRFSLFKNQKTKKRREVKVLEKRYVIGNFTQQGDVILFHKPAAYQKSVCHRFWGLYFGALANYTRSFVNSKLKRRAGNTNNIISKEYVVALGV